MAFEPSDAAPWLSIVGIGEDGVEGLGAEAKRRVSSAETVFGGRRHLELVRRIAAGELRPWPSPFDPLMGAVIALRGKRICVLASGDPFMHGVGATLSRWLPASEMAVFPAPSAFSLAAARLGWSLPETQCLSLHGKALDLLRPHLQPGAQILALTSDAEGPAAAAQLLAELGFGRSRLIVLEALGGPDERLRRTIARGFDLQNINALNLLAMEVESDSEARILPRAPGLPDHFFEHDGQITKREIRALTLSALAPRRGELLWDVGAGSGSVGIEWMLADTSLRAVAVERDGARAARIRRNAAACGVPGLALVEGSAPAALAGLQRPDAVFVGGGGSQPGVMTALMDALPAGGRLVANAVTLEMETLLLTLHSAHGGDLVRLAFARAAPVGGMTGWRPAMPVTQWAWRKP